MKKGLLVLLILLLILPLSGCFGPPVTKEDSSTTPRNAIKLVPYVTTTHQYYSGYISSGHNGWGASDNDEATEDYFWIDIRNVGRNNVDGLQIFITNEPDGWEIHEIDAIPEPGYSKLWVEFDNNQMQIMTLYAQHDEETDKYHSELETTIMIRFRVSTGLKGGYDYDGDGKPDSIHPNDPAYGDESSKVGYFPKGESPYYLHFHVDSEEVTGDSIKLDVKITEEKEKDGLSNPDKPYIYNYYGKEM